MAKTVKQAYPIYRDGGEEWIRWVLVEGLVAGDFGIKHQRRTEETEAGRMT